MWLLGLNDMAVYYTLLVFFWGFLQVTVKMVKKRFTFKRGSFLTLRFQFPQRYELVNIKHQIYIVYSGSFSIED